MEDGIEVQETAIIEEYGSEDGRELVVGVDVVQIVSECAVSERDITPVTMDVESVDVAIFQRYVVDVVVAEDAPLCFCLETADGDIPYVVHVYSISIFIVAGICVLNDYVSHLHICCVGYVKSLVALIGSQIVLLGGVDGYIMDCDVVLPAYDNQVSDFGRVWCPRKNKVSKSLHIIVNGEEFAFR